VVEKLMSSTPWLGADGADGVYGVYGVYGSELIDAKNPR